MKRIYAVIDCNNFFVSCERVFRPELNNRPMIILSNNDGCAVSRSDEAKPLIPMGAPLFKYEPILKQHGVQWSSANFPLYGDMSRRVMEILHNASPNVEPYSVDEAFLQIGDLGIDDYRQWGLQLREQIMRWTGIPVSVGIASSKTLSKVAVERAKKDKSTSNVLNFMQFDVQQAQLKQLPIEDVWGVGRRLAPKLKAYGLRTAYDLQQADRNWLMQLYSVLGAQMIDELNGVDCFGADITFNQPPKKNITASRSFGERLREVNRIEPAIANFVTRAAARARKHQLLASEVGIYLVHGQHGSLRSVKRSVRLPEPTDDTAQLITVAQQLLSELHDPNLLYKKAGINLGGLVPHAAAQQRLDNPANQAGAERRQQLMQTIDGLNHKHGKDSVGFAAAHASDGWQPKRAYQSRAYTSSWSALPVVH